MNTPTLYIKTGCPYCAAAINYLDEHQIAYQKVDVLRNAEKMQKLRDLSGQVKTPTLDWDGEVLADFGVDELEKFLRERQRPS